MAWVEFETLSDSNFHTWKPENVLMLAFRDLNQYIEEDSPDDDEDSKKARSKVEMKSQPFIGPSPSDEHLKQVSESSAAKKMWNSMQSVFNRHKLFIKHAAWRMFYIDTMHAGEEIIP